MGSREGNITRPFAPDFPPGSFQTFTDDELLGAPAIAGVDYTASVLGASNLGGTLPDPALIIIDDFGNQIAFNDNNFALGSDPLITSFSIPFGTINPSFNAVVVDLTGGTGSFTVVADQAGVPPLDPSDFNTFNTFP